MPRSLEIPINPRVQNLSEVQRLNTAIEAIRGNARLSADDISLIVERLQEAARAGISVSETLRDLGGSGARNSPIRQAAKDVEDYIREMAKASDATQKWGRMMEMAYQENAKRDKKILDDLEEKRTAVARRISSLGTYAGGSVVGRAVGVPGLGFMSRSLTSGLSSTGAMAVGGIAAGLFAGVELAKSMDDLAKWAQAQKNAAAETGVTVTEMEQLSRISDRTGLSLTGAAKSVQDLSKEMEQGGARAREIQSAFSELGLKSSVAFEEPYQGLVDIQKALTGIKDPAERDRIAIELLGEAAGRTAAATAGMAKSVSPQISPQAMEQLARDRDTIAQIGEQWDLLKSRLATPLNAVLNVVNGAFSLPGIFDQNPHSTNTGGGPGQRRFMGMTPAMSDLVPFASAADLAAQRNSHVQSWLTAHGTPEDRYRATSDRIQTDEQALRDKYQAGSIGQWAFDSGMAALEGRRATAEAQRRSSDRYRSEVESFQHDVAAPVDSADVFRQLSELPRRYDLLHSYGPYQQWMRGLQKNAPGAFQQIGREMLNRQFPGLTSGDFSRLYSPMTRENEEFQHTLERQEQQARQDQEGARRDQRQRLDDITAGVRDRTEGGLSALRLRSAIESGARMSLRGSLSPAGMAQLDLEDQLGLIQQTYFANANPIQGAIAQQRNEAAVATTADDRQAIERQITNEQTQLQKLQNDRLTQSVDALNKFNESVDEASNKIKDEFGSFSEGLFSAGLKGKAGSYSRNFLIGQATHVVGNFAQDAYSHLPGIFSIPGQGTPDSPTWIGKMLQGTIFAQDPKAQQNVAVTANTTATDANTAATLALVSALGVDPGSLGLSIPSGVSIPSISGAASGGSISGEVGRIAKGLGISLPGAGSSGGGVVYWGLPSEHPQDFRDWFWKLRSKRT